MVTNQFNLDGISRIDVAIQHLKQYEPKDGLGYWLGFSGGKDSIVCYDLCTKAGVKFEAHYSVTTIDPPAVTKFIREHYSNIVRDVPMYKGKRTNFYELVSIKGLPRRQIRWCCSLLKESNGAKGRTFVFGVRRAESAKRAKRDLYYTREGKHILNPIIDWSDNEVWDYIRSNNLAYPSVYDEGAKRVGCILCPLACNKKRVVDYNKYPQHVKAIERAVDTFLKTHPESSLHQWGDNAHDIVYQWVYQSPKESAKGACMSKLVADEN